MRTKSHRFGPRFLGAIASLISLILLTQASVAAGAGVKSADDRAYLYRLFEVKRVGAEVVIAVDTSLSMKKAFPAVKQALDSFSKILQADDRVTVIVFDNTARRVYRGAGGAKARVRKALPAGPSPGGHRTNMGEAVAAVLSQVEKGQGRLPVVVFLTDGVEDPPPGSRFAVRPGSSWEKLRKTAAASAAAKGAYVQGIGLNKNTDIDKLKQVWPQIRPLTMGPAELDAYFVTLKAKIRQERLRRAVETELRTGRIQVRPQSANWGAIKSGATFKRTFIITSTYKRLPVEVNLSGASWTRFESLTKGKSPVGNLPVFAQDRQKITLEPGAVRKVQLVVEAPKVKGRFGLKTEERYQGRVRLKLEAAPKAAGAIGELGADPKVRLSGAEPNIWFNRSIGQSLYLLLALALAVLALAAVSWRKGITPVLAAVSRRLWAPTLYGRLAFSGAPAGERLPRPLSLDGFGRRTIIGASGKVRLKGKDIKERHAEIFTQWDQGEAEVMIQQREGIVRVSKSPGAPPVMVTEPTKLKPGSVIQIGDYKIQWI